MSGFHAFWSQPFTVQPGAIFSLDREESHHLVRVLRAKPGDPVTVLDGRGQCIQAILTDTSGRECQLRVDALERAVPLTPAITLGLVITKGKTHETILRQATECGVTHIQSLFSQRCEVRYDDARQRNREEKWRTQLIEACKQSGNPYLPTCPAPLDLHTWLKEIKSGPGLKWIGSLEDDAIPSRVALAEALNATVPPASVTLLIGPEGDFTPGEYASAREAGFCPLRMSGHILRTETAALAQR
jgi:16S rRNA (uracil1498-N3)-methyltransferase